jgi:lipopolysaccharide export system protein LptA
MNSKPQDSAGFSRSDADFLAHLTDVAETIEPDPTFKAALAAKLLQTQSQNSSQTTQIGTHPMYFFLPRLNRRVSLVTCAALAIVAALLMPTLTSRQTTAWLATFFNSAINSQANAQTIAQAMAAGEVTLMADAQDFEETTQTVRATGNVVFAYPAAQIQAKADEIFYTTTSGQLMLRGNVRITQRGETLRGKQATCSFKQKQCTLTQE